MSITKTNLNEEEIKKIVELDKTATKEIDWWGRTTAKEFKDFNKKRVIYSITWKKQIVGFARTKELLQKDGIHNAKKKEKTIALEDLYILEKYRKKGLATKTLKEIILDVKKQRFDKINLSSGQDLEKFYKKSGFKTYFVNMHLKLK
jgi:predicted acetyltransferase